MLSKLSKFPLFDSVNEINQQHPSKTHDQLQSMRGKLNSERIKFLFGAYDVALVLQENNSRVSNLNSNGVMRTCAIVNFSLPVPTWLKETHDKIYSGSTIGQTIKDNGFDLKKEDAYFGLIELPEAARAMMKTVETLAAIHIYQLSVINPAIPESITYCTITEIHSPLYLTLGDLNELSADGIQQNTAISDSVKIHLAELSNLEEWLSHSKSSSPEC